MSKNKKNNNIKEEEKSYVFKEYEISSVPNDFNMMTIYDYIKSDFIKLPNFQRNYIWDIAKASKFIESIMLGLPIPQIFLYEKEKNNFYVIDGQQRLLTLYYFIEGRFPRKSKRNKIRKIFDKEGCIPEQIFKEDQYFSDFALTLPSQKDNHPNPLNGFTYNDLEEKRKVFDIKTIRNLVIKQNYPDDGHSAMYEIFNRLNYAATNLNPQEIRNCLYNSDFYKMLFRINLNDNWRVLIQKKEPDDRYQDVELILRMFSMLQGKYSAPMSKYLNGYSEEATKFKKVDLNYLEDLFNVFTEKTIGISENIFLLEGNKRKPNISFIDAIFYVMCAQAFKKKNLKIKVPSLSRINKLKKDKKFILASLEGTASKKNVELRRERANKILF